MDLMTLSNGKIISINSNRIIQKEAIEIAKRIVEVWGLVHPKARYKLLIEVEPKTWSDCPHYETLTEGLYHEGYGNEKEFLIEKGIICAKCHKAECICEED